MLNEVLGSTSIGMFNMNNLLKEFHQPGLLVISDEVVGMSDAKEMYFAQDSSNGGFGE